jgi:micrococcal nuclease
LLSAERLRELIEGKDVIMVSHRDRTGKYGRWLATIHMGGININKLLLEEGWAKIYK